MKRGRAKGRKKSGKVGRMGGRAERREMRGRKLQSGAGACRGEEQMKVGRA